MTDSLFDTYRTQSQSLADCLPGFEDLRSEAAERLSSSVMPTSKSEAFRYANIKRIKASAYALAAMPANETDIPASILTDTAVRIVYINGHYSEAHSQLDGLPDQVMVRALSNYFDAAKAASLTERFGGVDADADPLALLNTALARDGIAIQVPAGVVVSTPIEILHLMTDADTAAAYPRHIIELGEGAKLTVVEHYQGDDTAYWLNETLTARVSESAELTHVRIVEDGAQATSSSRMTANVDANGRYQGLTVALSGDASRFETNIRLLGEGSHAQTDAILLARGSESQEMLTHITHTVPNATSDQVVRAVASGRGKTAFQGKITVVKDAQQTEADQSVRSLLLDRTAEAIAKPELEIWADDVKCSHGATVGELDADAYFYLLARGVQPADAKRILIDAFAGDALGLLEGDLLDTVNDKIGAAMERAHSTATATSELEVA